MMRAALAIVFGVFAAVASAAVPDLIPMPGKVTCRRGAFLLKAKRLSDISLSAARDAALPKEGYCLNVTEEGVRATAADDAGAFYALQTLRQLAKPVGEGVFAVPCVEIADSPKYRWRGVMLDDSRHFLGKETVMKVLDLMGQYKLNVLHWHLVDDQGWRLEIKKHPELVEYGAVRPASVGFAERPTWPEPDKRIHYEVNTERYGPFFYTQDDVREILAYAAARHITVVPEIELPGHERALLAARPDLGCRGSALARVPRVFWSIESDVLCAGNDDVLRYLEDIFDEVCELFPSEIIHIGGDECPKTRWQECPKCQARKAALGLADERGLQAWMTAHFAAYLAKKGRRIIGWDEVLHGDVPKSVIGMSWRVSARGGAGGDYVSAADGIARGFDMVMTPNKLCYYSAPQALPDDPYPYYSGGNGIPLAQAYTFDPMANLPESARPHVLGGQASIWTESIWTRFDLEWKMWPRTFAMAEILWSDPPAPRDYEGFRRRAAVHRRRLIAQHVNCAPVP